MPELISRIARVAAFGLLLRTGAPMHAADTPPVLPQDAKVYSPDRHFYAVSLLKAGRTCVYRAGAKQPLWETPGYAGSLYLSNDGKHLVKGYAGGNLFDANTKASDPFITFYDGPKITATLTVEQVFPHWHDLTKTTSGWAWGDFWGFEKPDRFVLRLHDGKKLAFNADTGKQTPW